MKSAKYVITTAVCALLMAGTAGAQDAKDAPAKPDPARIPAAAKMLKANFSSVFGTVTKIDTSNPAKPVIEVKNSRDGKVHTIQLTPATNITKVTDISELKQGENVRVMARTLDGAETALNVSFGKIKPPAATRPMARGQKPAGTPPEAAVKK